MRQLLVVALLAALWPASARAGNGDALLPYVPSDATMVVGFDGIALRESTTFQRFYGMVDEAEVASDTLTHLRELGVDPASMVDTLLYAAVSLDEDEDDVALLVQFDESVDNSTLDARLAEWATEVEEFLGSSCYAHEAGFTVARVTDRVMIAGPSNTVRGAIASASDEPIDDDADGVDVRPVGPTETLLALVEDADRTGLLWMAVDIPDDSDDPWLAPLHALTASLSVDTTVEVHIALTSRDVETAASHAEEIRAGARRLAGAPEVRALGLDAVLGAVEVNRTEDRVDVSLQVDEPTWAGLLEMAYAVVESELR